MTTAAQAQPEHYQVSGTKGVPWRSVCEPVALIWSGSVFVDVVSVLVMPVTVVKMVDVITVLHGFAAITTGVGALVVGVDRLLWMTLVAVHVIEVVFVLDRLAAVPG